MINMQEWMEMVGYKISEGGTYGWACYGMNAYFLDSQSSSDGCVDTKGHSFTIVFDSVTQEVYEVQAHDFLHNRAYRMINPIYVERYKSESAERGVDNEAWEGADYIDLEVDDDFIQKCLSIASGEDYDTRVSIPLDLPESDLMSLFKMAHEADMTFNDYVTQILYKVLEIKGGKLYE